MYCYLKGTLPSGSARSMAWWGQWLLIGTDEGTLKAFKIPEDFPKPREKRGDTDPLDESEGKPMNTQSHEAHAGQVRCVCADRVKGLVATGDTEGGINIWDKTADEWRRRSTVGFGGSTGVVGLQWISSKDPSPNVSLCALHEEGRLHSGTPEGLRLWSRDVRKACACLCVVPNDAGFVVATQVGELLFYDSRGVYTRRLPLKTDANWGKTVKALTWQPGSWASRPLLVAYNTGHALLMHTERDIQALPIDTGLSACAAAEWGPSGSLAVLLGVPALSFATPEALSIREAAATDSGSQIGGLHLPGMLLRLIQASGEAFVSVDLPSGDPRALAWSPNGEHIAAASKESLFVLSLRQDGMCCFYGGGALAAGALVPQRLATEVCFWRNPGKGHSLRVFQGPRFLISGGDRCAIVPYDTPSLPSNFAWDAECYSATQQQQQLQSGPYLLPDEESLKSATDILQNQHREQRSKGFPVELCDSAGNTVETVVSPLGPRLAVVLPQWLVVSDGSQHLWCSLIGAYRESTSGLEAVTIDLDSLSDNTFKGDGVIGLGGRGECVIVARAGGQLLRLKLSSTKPYVQFEACWLTPRGLECLRLSAETSSLAGRDAQRRLHILRATSARGRTGSSALFSGALCEPVDEVLDYMWASDHDDFLAVLQQTQMLLVSTGQQAGTQPFRMGFEAYNGPSNGPLYLIDFSGLCAKALCLTSFLKEAGCSKQNSVISFDAEPLLQMRQLVDMRRKDTEGLEKPGALQQAAELAASFNHPILWKLLADSALAHEKLDVVEEALVRCEDYCGLQVLKRARRLEARGQGRPVIAAFAGDVLGAGAFYEAQKKHVEAACHFSAFGLWKEAADALKLAEMFRHRGDQTGLRETREALAEAWSELGECQLAADFYSKVPLQKGLLEAFFFSDKYEELERLTSQLPERDTELLLRAAKLLAAAGRGKASASAFLKAGKPNQAVDAALQGGDWEKAIHLARQHCDSNKVQQIAAAYKVALQHQQNEKRLSDAVEAFIGLGIPELAAQELNSLTDNLGSVTRNTQLQRKLHVMAGMLARHRRLETGYSNVSGFERDCLPPSSSSGANDFSLSGEGDKGCLSSSEDEERHWRSAAACHLYLLCCWQLSQRRAHHALCAAVRLRDCYPRELPLQVRGRLLFITACNTREWALCSQALHTLETDPNVVLDEKKQMELTSLSLFVHHQLLEPSEPQRQLPCPRCNEMSCFWECFCPSCDLPFPWCAATGLPMRYILCLLQANATENDKTAAEAPLKITRSHTPWTTKEGRAPGDPHCNWPYGGPSTPKTCWACGLTTAAWGPEGQLRCCPLCMQPFSGPTEGLLGPTTDLFLWPEDDGAASYISTFNPKDIACRIWEIGNLTQP